MWLVWGDDSGVGVFLEQACSYIAGERDGFNLNSSGNILNQSSRDDQTGVKEEMQERGREGCYE